MANRYVTGIQGFPSYTGAVTTQQQSPAPTNPEPHLFKEPVDLKSLQTKDLKFLNPPKKSVGEQAWGWVAQQGEDLWNLISGIPQLVIAPAKGYYGLITETPKIIKDYIDLKDFQAKFPEVAADPFSAVQSGVRETSSTLWGALTEHYRDHDGKFTWESVLLAPINRPIPVAMDALTLVDLGASAGLQYSRFAAKAAAAKRGLTGAKAERFAERVAQRLGKPYQDLRDLPYKMAGDAAMGVVKRPTIQLWLKRFGWDEVGLSVSKESSAIRMEMLQNLYRYRNELRYFRQIPADRQLVLRDLARGFDVPDLKSLTDVEKHFIAWNAKVEKRLQGLGENLGVALESGPLTPELKAHAKRRHLAGRSRLEITKFLEEERKRLGDDEYNLLLMEDEGYARAAAGADFTKEELALADSLYQSNKAKFDAMKASDEILKDVDYDDLFVKHVREEPDGRSFIEKATDFVWGRDFGPARDRVKQYPTFGQRYFADQGEIDNLLKASDEALIERFNTYADLAVWQHVKAKHGKPYVRGQALLPGHVAVPDIFESMVSRSRDHYAVKIKEITEQFLKELPDNPTADDIARMKGRMKPVVDELTKELYDGVFNKDRYTIQIPKEVARPLEIELEPTGMFGRLMDTWLNRWRYLVLNWSGRYYVNNVLSNAVLTTLQGSPEAGIKLARPRKSRATLEEALRKGRPAEVGMGMQALDWSDGQKFYEMTGIPAMLDNLFNEATMMTDKLPRSALLDSELRKALGERLKLDQMKNLLGDLPTEQLMQAMYDLHRVWREESATQLGRIGFDYEPIQRKAHQMEDARVVALKERGTVKGRKELSKLRAGIKKGVITKGEYKKISQASKEAKKSRYGDIAKGMASKEISAGIEESIRFKMWEKKYKPVLDEIDRHIGTVEKWLGAYGKMSPAARRYLRRVVPFWTFQKTMFSLLFQMPFIRPKTSWMANLTQQLAMDSYGDERLPERFRRMHMVGMTDKGKFLFVSSAGLNPFEGMLRRPYNGELPGLTEVGGVPVPTTLDPLQNPIFMVVHQAVGGRDFFGRPQPLEPGQIVDSAGRVWEYDGKRIRQITPQREIIEALLESTPQGSLLNDIMAAAGFDVFNSGYKAYKVPGGGTMTPDYIKNGLQGLLSGIRFEEADQQAIRRQDKMRKVQYLRGLVKQAMRAADPEERDQVRRIANYLIQNEK